MSRRAHGRIRRIGLTNAQTACATANSRQILERIVVIAQVLVGSVREAFPLTRWWCVRSDVPSPVVSLNRTVSSRLLDREAVLSITALTSVKIAVFAPIPESECQHRDDRKRFSFPQSAESVT